MTVVFIMLRRPLNQSSPDSDVGAGKDRGERLRSMALSNSLAKSCPFICVTATAETFGTSTVSTLSPPAFVGALELSRPDKPSPAPASRLCL
jgi:hypothetical protein